MTVRAVVSTENSKPFRKAVPLRTGLQFLESLNDGRAIFVNGERVKNVATHPAFAEGARSAAQLFDIAADPLNRECMTYTSPISGSDSLPLALTRNSPDSDGSSKIRMRILSATPSR